MRGLARVGIAALVACGARTDLGSRGAGKCAAQTIDLQVPGAVPWTDTGIDLASGTELVVHASGKVRYGGDPKQVQDANGVNFDGQKFFSTAVLPQAVVASLIGKIGGTTAVDTGTPLPEGKPGDGAGFVGTDYDQIVPVSGRLFLGYNDQRQAFADNSGAFDVAITTSAPCRP